MAANPILATLDLDSIIERIAAGEYQSHIAIKAGIAPQTLHYAIVKHPGYRDALKLRNMAKLDASQSRIDDVDSDLARAREAFKAAAWRAERECPSEWGQHTQVTVSTGDLGERIRRARERVIEPEPTTIEDVQVQQVTDAEITERSLTNQVLESKG